MTDRQFRTLRNLLSWIVVALFLLVAKTDIRFQKLELSYPISVASFYLAVGFLLMLLFRPLAEIVARQSDSNRADQNETAD